MLCSRSAKYPLSLEQFRAHLWLLYFSLFSLNCAAADIFVDVCAAMFDVYIFSCFWQSRISEPIIIHIAHKHTVGNSSVMKCVFTHYKWVETVDYTTVDSREAITMTELFVESYSCSRCRSSEKLFPLSCVNFFAKRCWICMSFFLRGFSAPTAQCAEITEHI